MLPYSQLVESTASVKSSCYFLSDIEHLPDEPLFSLPKSWLPFFLASRPKPSQASPQEPVAPLSVLPAGPRLEAKALPLQWLLDPEKDKNLPERIFARLIQLEAHEPDVWLRDDYRQSFITLHLALEGNPQPFVSASYQMYGVHPDKLWAARIEKRKALLGPLYEAITKEEVCQKSMSAPVRSVAAPSNVQTSIATNSKPLTATIATPTLSPSKTSANFLQAPNPLAGEQALPPSSPALPGSPKKSPTSETSDKERAA